MLMYLPLPTWDSLHPLIIHFPIVLLIMSPLFILIGAAMAPLRGRPYMVTALILLLLGTGSMFLAVQTGEAASELAERGGGVDAVLYSHETLAEETRSIFVALSALFLAIFVLPKLLGRAETRLFSTVIPLSFLLLFSVGIIFLVNTAHAGGRLVHEFGVHAMVTHSSTETVGSAGEVKTE